jgi:hypothetical protein
LASFSFRGKDFPHAEAAASFAPHSIGEVPATPPCRLRRDVNGRGRDYAAADPLHRPSRRPRLGLLREQATVVPSRRMSGSLSFRQQRLRTGSDRRRFEREASRNPLYRLRRGKSGAARLPKAADSLLMRNRGDHLPRPGGSGRRLRPSPILRFGSERRSLDEMPLARKNSPLRSCLAPRLGCLRAASSQGHPTVSQTCPQGAVFASVHCGNFGSPPSEPPCDKTPHALRQIIIIGFAKRKLRQNTDSIQY